MINFEVVNEGTCPVCDQVYRYAELVKSEKDALERGVVITMACTQCAITLELSLEEDQFVVNKENPKNKAYFAPQNPFESAGWPSLPVKDLSRKKFASDELAKQVFPILAWLQTIGKEAARQEQQLIAALKKKEDGE